MIAIDGNAVTAGADGKITLASGSAMSMRLWLDEDPHDKPTHRSTYETLGYVIAGQAELTVSGEIAMLSPGVSYRVPAGVDHTYRFLERFTAVECMSPALT
jgi:quercetin dioxygenase-like cupin family protein